jgi:dipeptidyl aminopeptidase/acylaminoacyl peptidase
VKPADIALIRTVSRPAIAADGSVVVAVTSPDVDADLYRGTLHRIPSAADDAGAQLSAPTELTVGPRDSDPVADPAGRRVVFRRAAETGPAQLYLLPLDGGEPRQLTEHPLGAGPVVFSPDGRRVAYTAAVPEPGRYGTDEDITAAAEAPRRITRRAYRLDGEGFVLDKPAQLFLLDLDGGSPVQLTDEPSGVADPCFADNDRLLYVRPAGVDALTDELAVLTVPNETDDSATALEKIPAEPTRGTALVTAAGSIAWPVPAGDHVVYFGAEYAGVDAVAQTLGVWAVPLTGGRTRRLTERATVHVERAAGRPQIVGERVLAAVLDRGAVAVRSIPLASENAALADLELILGSNAVVSSFDVRGRALAAVVADGGSPAEVVTTRLAADSTARRGRWLTDFGAGLAGRGLRPATELTTSAPDGYPVHGWLVTPEGPGPHPVLLVVHGGPFAAYGPAFFDEAQVYAGAGYAVVLGNPRGSAGYGENHGRSVVGALGTVDVDDLLALLDAALARPECDAGRVGVMGGSYGGFMTSWLASHAPDRFVAAISERAVNAWDSFAGSSDIGYYFAQAYVGADREALWQASPLAHADDIAMPLLIIHSEQDWRCPVEQAQRMFVALKNRGAETEMLLFPGEGHELSRSGRPRHRLQRFEAILDWWGRHLPSGS